MKTIILISPSGFLNFRFDLISDHEQVRFIGIFSEEDEKRVTPELRSQFETIYVVGCKVKENPSSLEVRMVDPLQTLEIVKEIKEDSGELYLLCYDEQNMDVAAAIRSDLNIPGPKSDVIALFRDKVLMKDRLVEHGIRIPKYGRHIPSSDLALDYQFIKEAVGDPFIFKPIDSAGSDGVYIVRSYEDFLDASQSLNREYEYEEFIDGTIYSINIISQDKKIVFAGVTEYLVNTFQVRMGRVNADINLQLDDPMHIRMVAFAEEALLALDSPDCFSHMEVFLTPNDEIVFLEVAARPKGLAGMAAMERHFGLNLMNLTFNVETGIETDTSDIKQEFCFDGVVPCKAGTVKALHEPEVASRVDMMWQVKEGDVLSASDSLLANGGAFLLSNSDPIKLREDFERLASYEPIEYEH